MAEQTGLRNNALPYPIYGVPFGVTFPLLDADGDPITPSSPDSERSLNGDTFADCTNEAVEIATSSGICYLLLTAAEMTADITTVRIESTGAKTTVLTLYPRKLVTLRSGTAAGGATGSITLDGSASAIDDYYNGCVVVGTLDTLVEARVISDYVGSTKVASVVPNWNTTPDSDDTFIVLIPDGTRQYTQADTAAFGGTAGTFASGRPEVNTTHIAGSAVSTSSAQLGVNVVNAAGTAWASGAITTGVFASGAINAAAIAADAIGASELAADAVTEIATAVAAPTAATIADAVWDEDATAHQTTGTFGQAIGDPVADTNTIYKAVVTDAAGATVGVDVVAVQADTDNIQTRIPAALVSGRIDASVGAMAAGTVTAAAIATDAIDADAMADGAITAATFAAGAIDATAIAADAIGSSELATSAVAEIADAMWDEVLAGTTTGRQLMRLFAATLGGKASGLGTTTAIYRNLADTMNVVSATVDADGNRTAVTLDLDDTP